MTVCCLVFSLPPAESQLLCHGRDGFHRCENNSQETRFIKKGPAVLQSVCNFPWMPEVGVHTEDMLQCSGSERLLWNALTKVNFANCPDPLKLKADEASVW